MRQSCERERGRQRDRVIIKIGIRKESEFQLNISNPNDVFPVWSFPDKNDKKKVEKGTEGRGMEGENRVAEASGVTNGTNQTIS